MTGFEWWWSWLLAVPRLALWWQVGNRKRWAWLLASIHRVAGSDLSDVRMNMTS